MHIDDVISQVRSIMKTHYNSMKALDMEGSDPVIQKKDLSGQLQAFIPGFSDKDMPALYRELEQNGYATLITNDTITFSKDFVAAA